MLDANRSVRNYGGITSPIVLDSDDILNVSKPDIKPYGDDFPLLVK
ncbi:hypothetical protein EhV18_00039 [Emiliania huxleyi virus 18]|nr:hypothetical protein EhV18_00039 [Emiliania huxleyi virus 18]AHA55139.1 hypothetical protein EhV156_00038 [Emiliania huxleyi virus 156]